MRISFWAVGAFAFALLLGSSETARAAAPQEQCINDLIPEMVRLEAPNCLGWANLDEWRTTTASGNIRARPSGTAPIEGRFQAGERFHVYGRIRTAEREWYAVGERGSGMMTEMSYIAVTLMSAEAEAPAYEPPPLLAEAQAHVDRCVQNRRRAHGGPAQEYTRNCVLEWTSLSRAQPMAEAILPFFRDGRRPLRSLRDVQAMGGPIAWRQSRDDNGQTQLSARVGEFDASVSAQPSLAITLGWMAAGEPIALDIENALAARGARVTMVACANYGVSELATVHRVEMAGHTPFILNVAARHAPTASATSYYSVSAELNGPLATLASLRRADPDAGWNATCVYD